MAGFVTSPAYVAQKPLTARRQPSRFALTYAFELQICVQAGVQLKSASRVVNLPINPTRYEVKANNALAIKHTIGGLAADEGGFLEQDITVAGTCGLSTKTGWSAGTYEGGGLRGGGIVFADGNTLWRELRNLFRVYHKIRDDGPLVPRMIWHDFLNDDHWVVLVKSWSMPRDAREHRIHLPYEIEMVAVADDDASNIPLEARISSTAQDLAGRAVGYVNLVTGFAADAGALVREVNTTIHVAINAVLGSANAAAAAAQGINNGIRDTLNVPKVAAIEWRATVSAWKAALGAEIDNSDPWTPTDQRASDLYAQYEQAAAMEDAMDGLVASGAFLRSWPGTSADGDLLYQGERLLSQAEIDAARHGQGVGAAARGMTARATAGSADRRIAQRRADAQGVTDQTRSYTGQRPYTVRQGDTLLSIAQREMGAQSYWRDVALANRLHSPFISQLRQPGTVWIGDVLMIPTFGPGALAPAGDGQQDGESAEIAALGCDIYLNDAKAWEVDPATSTDVRLVAGIENYEQALMRLRFAVEIGTNLVFPEIGILTPIGEPNTQGIPDAIAVGIRRAALSDPRTASITNLVTVDTGDGVAVDITVVPKGARTGRVLRQAVE